MQKKYGNRVRLFQQHVGKFFVYRAFNLVINSIKSGNVTNLKKIFMSCMVSIGVPGMPDVYGIIKNSHGYGLFLGIEIKTGNAKQSEKQKKFQKIIESLGGVYIVGRSLDQVIEDIENNVF